MEQCFGFGIEFIELILTCPEVHVQRRFDFYNVSSFADRNDSRETFIAFRESKKQGTWLVNADNHGGVRIFNKDIDFAAFDFLGSAQHSLYKIREFILQHRLATMKQDDEDISHAGLVYAGHVAVDNCKFRSRLVQTILKSIEFDPSNIK